MLNLICNKTGGKTHRYVIIDVFRGRFLNSKSRPLPHHHKLHRQRTPPTPPTHAFELGRHSSTDASACGAPPTDQVHGIAAPSFQWRHAQPSPPPQPSSPPRRRRSTGLHTTHGPLRLRRTGWGRTHPQEGTDSRGAVGGCKDIGGWGMVDGEDRRQGKWWILQDFFKNRFDFTFLFIWLKLKLLLSFYFFMTLLLSGSPVKTNLLESE